MREKQENYLSIKFRNLFLETYAATYKGLKVYFRYPAWVISDVVATPLWMLMLIIPLLLFLPLEKWRNPCIIRNLYWGMIFWRVISLALWEIGMSIRREQQIGTIEYLFLTNANRIVIFSSRVLSSLISLSMEAFYAALIMHAFFGVNIEINNLPLLVLALVLSMIFSMGMGAVYGAFVLKIKSPGALSNILQFILLGFSSILIPPSSFPDPINIFVYVNPFSYASDLVKYASTLYQTMLPVNYELCLLAFSAITSLVLGLKTLDIVERNNRKKGTLGVY